MAPPKRRRPQDDSQGSQRNSPHRPGNLSLAQHNPYQNGGSEGSGNNGGRRSSRGGQGGRRGGHSQQQPQSPISGSNAQGQQTAAASPAPSNAMSPPPSTQPLARAPSAQNAPLLASKPSESAAPATPNPDSPPYHYEHLTAERIQSWRPSGRQAIIDDALQGQEAEHVLLVGVIFQELLQAALVGLIDRDDAGAVVKEILEKSSKAALLDLDTLFLDTFSIFAEVEPSANNVLRSLLLASGISPSIARGVLDASLLQNLGLVRNTFDRMGIRYSTNVLYRQSAYNLLREETEGYSKLMTEYFTVTQNFKPSNEVVADTYEKVKALIGAFDLDVGRVLDVTLDAFANSLVKHNKFFTKFLRISAWWPQERIVSGFEREEEDFGSLPPWAKPNYPSLDTTPEDLEKIEALKHDRDVKFWARVEEVGLMAFFELGGRRAVKDEEMSNALNAASDDEEENEKDRGEGSSKKEKTESTRKWIAATGTYPPKGNSTAAQILGFKLRFYASQARDANDILPETLIWLAALLIKIGFISIRDLYPHLYPLDESMDEVREKLIKEKEERDRKKRPGGGMNALTMAGALADEGPMGRPIRDSDPRSTPLRTDATTSKGSTPGKTDVDEKETLPEPADQKIMLLKSLLLIGAIPESLFILGRFPWLLDLHPDLPQYIHRLLHHSLSKIGAEFEPLANRHTLRQPGKKIASVLPSGFVVFEGREAPREVKYPYLEKTDWTENIRYRYYWQEWADDVPVCQTVDDVFKLCSTLLNLVGVKIGQDAALLTKLVRIGKKSLQDDTSHGNISRWFDLSKRLLVPALSLTRLNPAVVNEVWDLIKAFPLDRRYNIYAEWFNGQTSRLPDMKDAFELTKAETKDVLKRISRTNTREMARAFAKVSYSSPGITFTVTLSQIESYSNLVEFVVECTRYLTFFGYEVLVWSLLHSLGGAGRGRVQSDGMLTSSWLKALSLFAGKAFKRFKALDATPVLRYVNKQLQMGNSTDLEVLEQIVESMAGIKPDTNFSEEQCLAMAGLPHLRSQTLKNLHDKRHLSAPASGRLIQALTKSQLAGQLLVAIARERQSYMDRAASEGAPVKVMSRNLSKIQDAFVQYLDMLRSFLSMKQFDAMVPSLADLLSHYGLDVAVAFAICRPSIQYLMDEADKVDEVAKADGKEKRRSIDSAKALPNGDVEMADALANKDATKTNVNGVANAESKDVVMKDAAQPDNATSTKALLPLHSVLADVMDQVKTVFTEDQINSISLSFYVRFWQLTLSDLIVSPYEAEVKRVNEQLSTVTLDRSDITNAGMKKKEAEKQRLAKLSADISDEMGLHMRQITALKKKITSKGGERELWFADFPEAKQAQLADALVQECFIPRLTLTPGDALYTAKFIFWVHKIGTPGFRTKYIIDRILRAATLRSLLFMWTEKEAKNFSVFLNEVLSQLRSWHTNVSLFQREVVGPQKDFPGFAKELREDGMGKAPIEYEEFRRDLFRWHVEINSAFKGLLTSDEYMRIRNAFQLLKGIHSNFPIINFHGKAILETVTHLSKTDSREDIKLSAVSLLADIKKHQKDWLPTQAFRKNEVADSASQPGPTTSNATNDTPDSNGVRTDAEDGEIEDAKKTSPAVQATPSNNASHLRPDSTRGGRTRTPDTQETLSSSARQSQPQSRPDPRASTPSANATPNTSALPPNVSRPEPLSRLPSSQLPPARPPHSLPNRPEGPIPGRERISHRVDHPPRPDSREAEQYGRLDRPTDVPRPSDVPPRDLIRDRRDRSPGHRSRGRTPEGRTMPPDSRDRRDLGWGPADGPRDPRDLRDHPDPRGGPPPRFARDIRDEVRGRDYESPRGNGRGAPEPRGPPSPYDARDRLHPPSTSMRGPDLTSPRDSGPAINPERAALIQGPDRPDRSGPAVNPERAQLINNPDDRRATLESRLERERQERQSRDQRNTRPQSPRRTDERAPAVAARAASPPRGDERRPASEQPAPPHSSRDRREDAGGPPPSAPRIDRLGQDGQGRGRELFQQTAAPPRAPQDLNHGRLSQAPQDPNYGRLNPTQETPSGPRGRGNGPAGRGGRNFTAPAPSGPRSMEATASPLQFPSSPNRDRAPPTGPSGAPPPSAPQGPAADQVHPSRLRQIAGGGPPSLQTNNIPTAPGGQAATAGSPFTPQGPRNGPRPSPAGNMPAPSPTSRFPPTGPASTTNNMQQRGATRMMANITGVLKQASDETGPSIRGRAGNRLPSQQTGPQSPTVPQSLSMTNAPARPDAPQPPRLDAQGRPDLMADRMSKVTAVAAGNDAPSPAGSGGAPDERSDSKGGRRNRHGEDRSSRRHRSRSRSPRRDTPRDTAESTRQRDEPPRNGGTDDRRDREKAGSDRDREGHGSRRGRGRDERDRERDRDGRDRNHGERRDRPRDEQRGAPRSDDIARQVQQPGGRAIWDGRGQRPPTPPPPPPPPGPLPSNGDSRGVRGGDRRDDRDRRDGGRDRKRGRGGEEGGPDSKRRRGP